MFARVGPLCTYPHRQCIASVDVTILPRTKGADCLRRRREGAHHARISIFCRLAQRLWSPLPVDRSSVVIGGLSQRDALLGAVHEPLHPVPPVPGRDVALRVVRLHDDRRVHGVERDVVAVVEVHERVVDRARVREGLGAEAAHDVLRGAAVDGVGVRAERVVRLAEARGAFERWVRPFLSRAVTWRHKGRQLAAPAARGAAVAAATHLS